MNVLKSQLAVYERALIEAAVHARKGNVSAAARDLGIDRADLYRRRRRLAKRLSPPSSQENPPHASPGAALPPSPREGGFSHLSVAAADVETMLRTSIDNQIQDLMHARMDAERVTGGPIDVTDRR